MAKKALKNCKSVVFQVFLGHNYDILLHFAKRMNYLPFHKCMVQVLLEAEQPSNLGQGSKGGSADR